MNDGFLWAATSNGISKIDPSKGVVENFRHDSKNPNSISSNTVYSLAEFNGELIAGTSAGFNLFDIKNGSFKSFTEKDGLTNNIVYGAVVDNQNNIWLSTNKGLSYFNPMDNSFHGYNLYDGIQSNIFNVGAYHKGKSGKLYFGGINGVTIFDPSKISINYNKPKIAITNFLLFNQKSAADSSFYYVGIINKKRGVES